MDANTVELWVRVLNFGAWGLAGYAAKYIIDDNNKIKAMAAEAVKRANEAQTETRLLSERLTALIERLSDLKLQLSELNKDMKENNTRLIEELKKEINTLKNGKH